MKYNRKRFKKAKGTDEWKQHSANSLDTLPPDRSDTSGQPEYQVQKKTMGALKATQPGCCQRF